MKRLLLPLTPAILVYLYFRARGETAWRDAAFRDGMEVEFV